MEVFSDLEDFWDDLPVIRLKYNALENFQEVFQTTSTSRKSSIKIDLSNLPLIFSVFKSFERFLIYRFFRSGFDMQVFQIWKTFWDNLHVSRLKYNALDDFL
ncbi:hypothetical protein Bca4012_094875 [Brassica carinata]